MSERNCSACSDLKEYAPEFAQNGTTSRVCNSLHNDTGFNPNLTVLHNDEDDLHDANDCLIGNMIEEIEAYDVCDWKDYMRNFVPNLYELLKAIICAIGGLWNKLNVSQYIGILTLYRTNTIEGDGSAKQILNFNANRRAGNISNSVLAVKSGYDGIVVTNTVSTPLLVDVTYNCSIRTNQNFACTFLVITRDGRRIGQTPFIVPNTYDQQVMAEPFILKPGQSTTLSYYFEIGDKNAWFEDQFGYVSGSSANTRACHDSYDVSDPENQESYFTVRVTSIVDTES